MKKQKAGMNYALAFQLTDEKTKSGNELRIFPKENKYLSNQN